MTPSMSILSKAVRDDATKPVLDMCRPDLTEWTGSRPVTIGHITPRHSAVQQRLPGPSDPPALVMPQITAVVEQRAERQYQYPRPLCHTKLRYTYLHLQRVTVDSAPCKPSSPKKQATGALERLTGGDANVGEGLC